ncbi:MAG: hypothetical protein KatS3mg129_0187 [Leptospiraceae bacterium]|nr:MAG: hypothetical protein KatS3mg129_0187 [Leptospiraceae bacterium]
MAVKFSEEVLQEYEEIASHYPVRRASLLPALWLAQREFGYISQEVMEYIAELVGVPYTRVYEVVEFYTMYQKKKPGKVSSTIMSDLIMLSNGSRRIKKIY